MQSKCPHCSKLLKVPDKASGKTVKCPGCSKTFTIPVAKPVAPPVTETDTMPALESSTPTPPEPSAKPKKKFKPILNDQALDRFRTRSRRKSSASKSEDAGEDGDTKKKSGKGKVLKVLGIGCLVLILIAVGAGYYVYKNKFDPISEFIKIIDSVLGSK